MDKLTKRQSDALNFIKAYMIENGVTPSIRDIAKGLNISSVASAHRHFKILIEKGYIISHDKNSIKYSVKGMKYVEDIGQAS